MANQLSWLTVTGYVYDVEQQNPNASSITPELMQVFAYVDFFPGTQASVFPTGFTAFVANLDHLDGTSGDTEVPLAPITARLMNGTLSTIAMGDPPGVELLANTSILNLANPLYYHTRWRNVTFGGATQAISNFAWQATTSTPVTGLTATPHTTGGTIATGTYWYGVTALLPGAETLVCPAVSASVTGPTGSVTLNWTAFAGATGYNIYRGLTSGALTTLLGTTTGATTFTGAGQVGTAVTAPATDVVEITSPNLPRTTYVGPR